MILATCSVDIYLDVELRTAPDLTIKSSLSRLDAVIINDFNVQVCVGRK